MTRQQREQLKHVVDQHVRHTTTPPRYTLTVTSHHDRHPGSWLPRAILHWQLRGHRRPHGYRHIF